MQEKLKACRYAQLRIQHLEEKKGAVCALIEENNEQESSEELKKQNQEYIDKLNQLNQMLSVFIIDIQEDYIECMQKLSELPIAQRMILELYYLEGMGLSEIAEELGYSERHCRRLLKISLEQMQTCHRMSEMEMVL